MCVNNTENKDGINEHNMNTDKDTLKLPKEETNISATPSHVTNNLATISTSVKDLTFVTLSPRLLMEIVPLKNQLSNINIIIVDLEAKNCMKDHEQNMKNDEYDTRFVDHNGKIVTRMDVKDIVRAYF